MRGQKALLQFSRPHTIIGTTLSVLALYLIALAHNHPPDCQLSALLIAWLSCLGANVYIVGINQITDIEIDRINKPYLPLAAGDFTLRQGWGIVLAALALALVLAVWGGVFLTLTVVASLLIGTAYSLPPIRLKRFHFWAAASIFTVRGVLVNIFLFLHFHVIFGGDIAIPPQIWALTLFMFGLSLVIAWFKDIPDQEGDRRFEIITLTLKLGPQRVFAVGVSLLSACYLGMILAGWWGLPGVNGRLLALSHALLLAVLWFIARSVNPLEKPEMTRFYLKIWGFFFLEYLVFPLTCLTA